MDGLVTAYNRPKAEAIITGLEDPINAHLVKLLAFDAEEGQRQHWKKEVIGGIYRLRMVRFKPDNRQPSAKFFYRILYDEPFGGVEEQNMRTLLDYLADDYRRNNKTVESIVVEHRQLHEPLAEMLAKGENPAELIRSLA